MAVEKLNGILPANYSKVIGIAVANFSKILGVTHSVTPGVVGGNDSNCLFLLPTGGDKGDTGHEVTVKGTPVLKDFGSNSFAEIVNFSSYANGTDAVLTVPDSADFDVLGSSSQDYTIEGVTLFSDHAGTETLVGQYEDASNYWVLEHVNGTGLQLRVVSGAITFSTVVGAEITDSNWHRWAVAKVTSGGPTVEWGIYIDQLQVGYISDADTDTFAGTLRLFARNSDNYLKGYNAVIAIHKANVYSATPDVGLTDSITMFSTIAEMTNDENTVLFLDFTEIDQGETPATFTDSSASAHTVTNVSSNVSGCTFWWDGAWDMNGSTDYLTMQDSTDWDFGTGDFTVDVWHMFDDAALAQAFISQRVLPTDQFIFSYSGSSGSQFIDFYATYGGSVKAFYRHTWVPQNGKVHNLQLGRVGANIYLFIDGDLQTWTSIITPISTNNLSGLAANLTVGASNGPIQLANAKFGEEQILKGICLNTTSFTPPTQPAIPDANTKLLLQPQGNTAIGSTDNHDITFTDGIVLTQEAPSGFDQSWQLDGAGDFIEIPDSDDFDINGTNVTLAGWYKFTDHVGTETLACQYEDASNYWVLEHVHGTGLQLRIVSGGTTIVTLSGGEIADTNWTFILLAKVANEYGIYKGNTPGGTATQVAYVSDADTDTFAGVVRIGALSASNYLDGYFTNPILKDTNHFSATPNATPDDTVTIPTGPYTEE